LACGFGAGFAQPAPPTPERIDQARVPPNEPRHT
jgi:hypothetical protein